MAYLFVANHPTIKQYIPLQYIPLVYSLSIVEPKDQASGATDDAVFDIVISPPLLTNPDEPRHCGTLGPQKKLPVQVKLRELPQWKSKKAAPTSEKFFHIGMTINWQQKQYLCLIWSVTFLQKDVARWESTCCRVLRLAVGDLSNLYLKMRQLDSFFHVVLLISVVLIQQQTVLNLCKSLLR